MGPLGTSGAPWEVDAGGAGSELGGGGTGRAAVAGSVPAGTSGPGPSGIGAGPVGGGFCGLPKASRAKASPRSLETCIFKFCSWLRDYSRNIAGYSDVIMLL